MSDDDLRKYMPRVSSILRHADPKRAAERKEGALASTDARETLPGVAPPAVDPWAAEAGDERPIDRALLPSTHQPGEVPLGGIETPVGPPPSRAGGRRGVVLGAVLVCGVAIAVGVFVATRDAPPAESSASLPPTASAPPPAVATVAIDPDPREGADGGATPSLSAQEAPSAPPSLATPPRASAPTRPHGAAPPEPAPGSSRPSLIIREEPEE